MTKDVHREETSKFAALSECIYNVLLALSLSLLFVIQPEISLRQSSNCLREKSMSAVAKDMYTGWSNLWL